MTIMGIKNDPTMSLTKYYANKNVLAGEILIKHLTLCMVLLNCQIFSISNISYLSTQGRKDTVWPLCPSLPHTRTHQYIYIQA